MSDEELRRVRRVIEGPAPAAPRPLADPRQAERFQRALGPVRRADPENRLDPRFDLRREPETPAAATPGGASSSAAERGAEKRPLAPVIAALAVTTAPDEPEASPPSPAVEPPAFSWPSSTAAWVPPPPDWDTTLVNTIAMLCHRTDPSLQGFSVTVPLNPEVLPHTELRLTLSQHYLQLRFRTESTRSHDLVLRHLDALRTRLAEALPDSRHLDIELT
jgi:hypothetical protein